MAYQWDFSPVLANAPLLAQGLANTLKITGTALVFGVALGLGLALLRLSPRRFLSWPAGFVIEVFRTTPPLVQLFWFFFALPLVAGIEMTPFMAAATTFSIQSAAFFAEVFFLVAVFLAADLRAPAFIARGWAPVASRSSSSMLTS